MLTKSFIKFLLPANRQLPTANRQLPTASRLLLPVSRLLWVLFLPLPLASQVFYEPVVYNIDSLERLLPEDRSERRAEVLLLLSSQLVLSDNEKCTEYAREAFEIATERKDERLLLHSKSALGLAAHHRGDYPAS
jgi:hypothetical protein